MIYSIRNEYLQVSASDTGAELMSVSSGRGTEYLWQGDASYWSGRAPVLFPYIGRLTKGRYKYKGKTYGLPIHGFARTSVFSAAAKDGRSVAFSLEDTEQTYEMYPFHFCLTVTYRLEDETLRSEIKVTNRGEEKMHFALGAHPGINVPLEPDLCFEDYYLEFPPCSPKRIIFTPEGSCAGEKEAFPLRGNRLALKHDLFDDDAVVLEGVPGEAALKSDKGQRSVTMTSDGFSLFGFWHKPKSDAPYICFEPWSSLPSRQGVVEDLETQSDLISLDAGKTYAACWSLTCR